MILIIDTTNKKCLVALADSGKIIGRSSWSWQKDTGGEALREITKICSKTKVKITKIEKILVNQGPGSYTGVRVGITLANTLGWVLNIPVVGYREMGLKDLLKVTEKSNSKFSNIVLPYYN